MESRDFTFSRVLGRGWKLGPEGPFYRVGEAVLLDFLQGTTQPHNKDYPGPMSTVPGLKSLPEKHEGDSHINQVKRNIINYLIFYLYQYIQNISISTCNQYKKY